MLNSKELRKGWSLRPDSPSRSGAMAAGVTPATVPGCVHTDLLAGGLIPDPFPGDNELAVAWVGRADWRYETTVPRQDTPHERVDLVFDGLDTVAEVSLGDRILGSTRNMHRSYRYDVTESVTTDDTALTVRFTSAYTEAEAMCDTLGPLPNAYPEPFNLIRKTACGFGWDRGPTLVTAGIWRPVRLEAWSTARLSRVRPLATLSVTGDGELTVHAEVERTTGGAGRALTVRTEIRGHGSVLQETAPVAGGGATAVLKVPSPELWWPRGYGAQARYECVVSLLDAVTGEVLDATEHRIGFRSVELDTEPDEFGSRFTLLVNSEPLFVRGVNWIPDDVFPSRITPARYRRRLQQAADANVDLVRVWGGGIYESDDFYDICDELGLLVWQDFPFTCAAYPEEEPLYSEVEAEARENVARLAPHPSLILWNGNNENLSGHEAWGWKEELAGRSWGEGYYLDLLPRVVAETDPTRPYSAGSPWSGSWDHHPDDPDHGTRLSWELWNRRDDVPRFVAEFGR